MGWRALFPFRLILLMPVLLAPTAPAQQTRRPGPPAASASAPKPATFPLETLRIEGNTRIPSAKIIAASGLKIGQIVVKADFDEARNRLMAAGAFESVSYQFDPSAAKTGYDAVLRVIEVELLFPYRFEELPLPENTLRAALRKQEPLLGDEVPFTPEVVNRYCKALYDLLGGKVEISGTLNNDLPGQTTILFRPPGTRSNVARVIFTGNEVVPSALLINTLGAVAIGTPYSEPNLRVLLDASIRPLYEARGRIRVEFPSIRTEKTTGEINGVVVTVAVQEGPSYNLGAVKFLGVPGAQADGVKKEANWQKNDLANFDDIKAALDRIGHRFRQDGYLHMTSRVDRDIHDDAHTVDLVVTVDPGPRFTFGKLEIAGLDLIGEPAVRKMWGLKEGKPFNPDYPESFLKDVRDENMFDNLGATASEAHVNEASKTVDVKLTFGGTPGPAASKNGRDGRGRN